MSVNTDQIFPHYKMNQGMSQYLIGNIYINQSVLYRILTSKIL